MKIPFSVSLCMLVLLVSPVSGILTDPGPVCPGNTVTLTCTIPGTPTLLTWSLDGVVISTFLIGTASTANVEISGVAFSISISSTTPDTVSQISFVASDRINGGTLWCVGGPVQDSVTLQLRNITGSPSDVRQSSNSTPGIEQSTVTIEWTPLPNGGNVVYTIATTPAPLSGAMPVTTSSTHITITVHYNTNYTITVAVNTTCAGVQQATANILIAGCVRPPAPDNGVLLPFLATNEGAEIVYHCGPGFQPQNNITSMCGSNALWTPDPALHNCTVDCGDPVLPSNVGVSAVSGTTEGAIVSFQCQEGLIPSHPINITCTSTGQWMPNPQNTQCSSEDSTSPSGAASSTSTGAFSSTSTGSPVGGSSGVSSVVVVAVVSSVLLFLVGLVCGFAAGALVVYCCARTHHRKPHPPPLPAPLYEEVVTTGRQQELKLQNNAAYGHFK